jgi:hypothetical protein
MILRAFSQPAPGSLANEDHYVTTGSMVAVFDGVTVPHGTETGCSHGPAWYVRRLGEHLAAAASSDGSLAAWLDTAICRVRDDHISQCDLGHPGTPAATVCMVREQQAHLDYLVLCDSPLVLDRGHQVEVVTDNRLNRVVADLRRSLIGGPPIGTPEHMRRLCEITAIKQQHTNQPYGYWIAAADPEAAHHALTGSLPLRGPDRVRRAALLTDGASCAVDRFRLLDWRGLLDLLAGDGPEELIRRVRSAERADSAGQSTPRYKQHDDATAALCLFDSEES